MASQRLAMAPGQRDLLDELPAMPMYHLDVQVEPAEQRLNGRMRLTLPAGWAGVTQAGEYVFRLYPNLAHYTGSMGIDLVAVNGRGAPFRYAAEDTAVQVVVPPGVVDPGEPVTIDMQWRLKWQAWQDEYYHLFGESRGVVSLPLFYPILAVPDAEAPLAWRLDMGEANGDSAFSQVALYQMTVNAPASYGVVSTGSLLGIEDAPVPTAEAEGEPSAPPQATKTWRMASGPAREAALFLSDRWRQAEAYAGDVRVNAWYLPEHEATGRATAEYAAAALRVYSQVFGPYPYAELDVVAGPLEFHGMEYPGLFELGFQLYDKDADELEFRVAHETAHQWWYSQVGNDPVNAPWLDEGLAEFATYYYFQKVKGQQAAENLADLRWQAAYDFARERGEDGVVNQPVSGLGDNYETLVYGKAALFHRALRDAIGDAAYLSLLRKYIEAYRFREATPEEFIGLAEDVAGPVARELYEKWIQAE